MKYIKEQKKCNQIAFLDYRVFILQQNCCVIILAIPLLLNNILLCSLRTEKNKTNHYLVEENSQKIIQSSIFNRS